MPDDEMSLLASVFWCFVIGVGLILIITLLVH